MTVSAIPPVLTLVSPDKSVPPAKLQPVAAALAVQVARDFAKPWQATAAVTTGKHPGAWEIRVQRDISEPGALGVHLDDGHQPYALVALTNLVGHRARDAAARRFARGRRGSGGGYASAVDPRGRRRRNPPLPQRGRLVPRGGPHAIQRWAKGGSRH